MLTLFKNCEIYDEETTKTEEECKKILPNFQGNYSLDIYSKCV